jgi:hypothetical protein
MSRPPTPEEPLPELPKHVPDVTAMQRLGIKTPPPGVGGGKGKGAMAERHRQMLELPSYEDLALDLPIPMVQVGLCWLNPCLGSLNPPESA